MKQNGVLPHLCCYNEILAIRIRTYYVTEILRKIILFIRKMWNNCGKIVSFLGNFGKF